uniref:Integrin beta n=1 Tax=Scleropages formosus TaxID=113540 RepID=A0A8C9T726_SCLFO
MAPWLCISAVILLMAGEDGESKHPSESCSVTSQLELCARFVPPKTSSSRCSRTCRAVRGETLPHVPTSLCPAVLSKEECPKTVVTSCKDCIRTGPFCAWCKKLNFTKQGEPDATRCDTTEALRSRGCENDDIVSPASSYTKLSDRPLSRGSGQNEDPVQLQPQAVRLNLRPGGFRRVEDYPVDLYYLMDLSYSMKDDLENVKSLGKDLMKALGQITKRARIGFGSFVDKVALPFTNTNPAKVQKPCPEDERVCQPAFGYQHVLSLTDQAEEFNQIVSMQSISGNLDSPEGGLDAIMQAAVCGNKIGWGDSTRLLVFATDDGFHMAGDGKLAAILEPNDGQCHLDKSIYSKSSEMDYPSVGQLAQKLAENNIQPIFAVTQNVAPVSTSRLRLRHLSILRPQSLSSNVIVTHENLPEDIKVTYTSNCENGGVPGPRGVCNNVGIGKEVEFVVTVTADKCTKEQSFQIGPLGFREKMNITVVTECECVCRDPLNKNDPACGGQGQVTCGTCVCNKDFVGQRCECRMGDKNERDLREACRFNNGSVCSNLGDCVCGLCQCHAGEDGRNIYGRFCECDDRSCPLHHNRLCGGNGKCDCGKCLCHQGYDGEACDCKKSDEACRKGTSVCSGRGNCTCNICHCLPGYKRPFCEECPGCPSPCGKIASCVECLGFNSGPLKENCNSMCSKVKHKVVEALTDKKPCRWKRSDNCWMIYSVKELDGIDNYDVTIQKKLECPKPPDLAAIIGGSFAGVALIGLLLLLILKGIIHMKDLKEFRRFENEKKKAKWTNADNPLFKTATTTVQNPNFSGD